MHRNDDAQTMELPGMGVLVVNMHIIDSTFGDSHEKYSVAFLDLFHYQDFLPLTLACSVPFRSTENFVLDAFSWVIITRPYQQVQVWGRRVPISLLNLEAHWVALVI